MSKQVVAGLLVALMVWFGSLNGLGAVGVSAVGGSSVVSSATQLSATDMEHISGGSKRAWQIGIGVVLAVSIVVMAMSGVGIPGAIAAGAYAEAIFAGKVFLAATTVAAGASSACDSLGGC